MNSDTKTRRVGLIGGIAMVLAASFNWYLLISSRQFYPMYAFFAPCLAVILFGGAVFPSLGRGLAHEEKGKKALHVVFFFMAAGVGFLNWYYMSRYTR